MNIPFDLLLPCGIRAYVVELGQQGAGNLQEHRYEFLWCVESTHAPSDKFGQKVLARGYKPTFDEAKALALDGASNALKQSQALLDGAR